MGQLESDPNEQANISGADFAVMCDRVKELEAATERYSKELEAANRDVDMLRGMLKSEQEESCAERKLRNEGWFKLESMRAEKEASTIAELTDRFDTEFRRGKAQAEEISYLKAQLSKFQMSEFNPDWSMLQASQESLREHMQIIIDLKAQLAEARKVPEGWQLTNAELTKIYNDANGITGGKNPPISTEKIFTAMRAMLSAAPTYKKE